MIQGKNRQNLMFYVPKNNIWPASALWDSSNQNENNFEPS